MQKEIVVMKNKDWSLNLEDLYYEDKPNIMIQESVEAVRLTKQGFYVNVVTPSINGDPRNWLIPALEDQLTAQGIDRRDILYIDECGCGGHVTRIFR